MSSGIDSPPQLGEAQAEPPSAHSAGHAAHVPPMGRYEGYVEDRIRQTRRQVKGVDIAGGLLSLVAGGLAYLLVAAVIDHWLVTGGLGFWGRLLLFLGLLAAGGYHVGRSILPPVLNRINPIFAAETIERSRPSLKNSLINFLLLRGHRREMPPVVYQALEQRAAADLSQVQIEVAVDRTHVIRLGYLLAGMLAVCCLYLVLSPKDLLSSAARVIWPWAAIRPPTRVSIQEIEPGDAVEFHGEQVTVMAKVDGVRESEPVLLYYTTSDGQSVDQAIPMTLPEGEYRYQCKLPPGPRGLQQDLEYHLTAGDCATRRFTIDVQIAPAIVVDRIEYDYPDYTEIPDRLVQRQGDIRAIEGTKVTIHATANQPIESARIDLNCDGRRELRMKSKNKRAAGRFTLRLKQHDPAAPASRRWARPEYDSYQLRFTDRSGRRSRRPIRHRIEVIRDLPPEIQLLRPQKEEVQLAEDGRLEIRVRAEDPDFALRRVVLRAEHDGLNLGIRPMLDELHQGEFEATYAFEPAQFRLTAGDRVLYWAEAEDNKEPTAGRSETVQQWITIIGPESLQPPQQQPDITPQTPQQRPGDDRNQRPDQPGEAPPPGEDQPPPEDQPQEPTEPRQPDEDEQAEPDGAGDQQSPDHAQGGQQDEAASPDGSGDSDPGAAGESRPEPPEQPRKPIDPETQPGDAFDEILKHRQQQNQDQGDGAEPGEQEQPADQKQPGAQPRPDDQKQPGDQQQPDDQQQPAGPQQPGEQQRSDEQTQPGEPRQPADQQRPGGQQHQPEGQQGPGEQQHPAGRKQSANQQQPDGRRQPGDPEQAPDKSGERSDDRQQSPGAGKPSGEDTGSPRPQGANQPREKRDGPGGPKGPSQDQESPKSPSISPKQSDSQGDESGDRSGGGEKGGGQQADRPGSGDPGSNTEADDGGSPAGQQGDGETGRRGGEQVETDRQTGHSARQEGDKGEGGRGKPGGADPGQKPNERPGSSEGGTPQTDPRDGGRPGERVSEGPGSRAEGKPAGGSQPGQTPEAESPPESREPGGDKANLEYSQKATDLALEHLKDQMKQDRSDLLERLGWTLEDAKKFIQRWEKMKRAAVQESPQGKTARDALDRALKSLGLRPRGTQLRPRRTGSDELRDMREAGELAPPAEWAEWLQEYSRGAAAGP